MLVLQVRLKQRSHYYMRLSYLTLILLVFSLHLLDGYSTVCRLNIFLFYFLWPVSSTNSFNFGNIGTRMLGCVTQVDRVAAF